MSKVEGFLKVVLCVTEATIDNFTALMPGAGAPEFQKVVEAKNISRQERAALLEEYTRRFGSGPAGTASSSGAPAAMDGRPLAGGMIGLRLGNLGRLGNKDRDSPGSGGPGSLFKPLAGAGDGMREINQKLAAGFVKMGDGTVDIGKKLTQGVAQGFKKLIE